MEHFELSWLVANILDLLGERLRIVMTFLMGSSTLVGVFRLQQYNFVNIGNAKKSYY